MTLLLVVALLNYFEPFAEESAAYKAYLIISPLWAFCIVPSYICGFYLFKKSCENLTMEENIRRGVLLGIMFGFEVIILPIIIAPVLAVMYFVLYLKNR